METKQLTHEERLKIIMMPPPRFNIYPSKGGAGVSLNIYNSTVESDVQRIVREAVE